MTGPQKTANIINSTVPFLNVAVLIIIGVMGYFLKSELDGLKLMRTDIQALWKETANIRADMAVLPKESPPPWFVTRVEKLETSVSTKIEMLQVEVVRLNIAVAKLSPRDLTGP